jgi:GT2 family glycosyltransferase
VSKEVAYGPDPGPERAPTSRLGKLKLLASCLKPLVRRPALILPSIWALGLRFRSSGSVGVKEGLLALRGGVLLTDLGHRWRDYQRRLEQELGPEVRAQVVALPRTPLVSVLVPCFNTPPKLLRKLVDSVRGQWYPHWELCISDDASTNGATVRYLKQLGSLDSRIRVQINGAGGNIARNTNRALAMARGEYVVLLDHDDLLQPQALYRIAEQALAIAPDFIYSDEARIAEDSEIIEFVFRPQFSLEFLRSHPYIVHLIAFRAEFLRRLGGLDEGLRISQDYDLILRAAEEAESIVHIPEILYLWRTLRRSAGHRMQDQVMEASRGIIQRHLDRSQLAAEVVAGEFFNFFEVRYPLRSALKVAVIIPTKNAWHLLRQCVESIRATVSAVEYRIVVVDHASDEAESLGYFEQLRESGCLVLRYQGDFNFSAINNHAVAQLEPGFSHYLFCNNDVQAIGAGWLERMLELAQQDDVAMVGPKLLYGDGETIQHAAVGVGIFAAAEHLGKFAPDRLPDGRHNPGYQGNLVCTREVSALTAACLLVQSRVFRELGGFDEGLAVGFGDTDLCLRARALGYRVIYCPHASLLHYESLSRGVNNEHSQDTERFRSRWENYMRDGDPYLNPNLSVTSYCWEMRPEFPISVRVAGRDGAPVQPDASQAPINSLP